MLPMKEFFSSLLVLLLIVSAMSSPDDPVWLSELFPGGDPADDALLAPFQISGTSHSHMPALLDQLGPAQVVTATAPVHEAVDAIRDRNAASRLCEPYVAVPGERAPPALFPA